MPLQTIKEILMERDKMSAEGADRLIVEAKNDFWERLDDGELDLEDSICYEWFGLEPDYIWELM